VLAAQQIDPDRGKEIRSGERISLSGLVTLPNGSPPPEGVEIETICNGRRTAQGRTKPDGAFHFTLGLDPTVSMSDARISGPAGAAGSDAFGRARTASTSGGSAGGMDSLGHVDLTQCEVRAVLPGYLSSVIQLGRRSAFENPEIGTIILTPVGEGGDPTVSATTLDAPKKAREAFEKGRKEAQKETPKYDKAAQEFQKAVAEYPRFAEAWYELGEVRLRLDKVDEAKQAFQSAIEADDNFQKPYPPLALIELKQNNLDESARLSDKVVGINPGFTEAHIYRAMAHHMLGHTDQAFESATMAVKQGAEQWFPRVLVILGDTTAQKDDFEGASRHYARYLELEPDSPTAQQVRKRLEEWKALGALK
jgi:Flp pilus assembly protein TadD